MRRYMMADPVVKVSLVLIATTLGFGALKIGADVFAPLIFALVTGVILAPLTEFLERFNIPNRISAFLILLLGGAFFVVLAVLVEPMIWQVADELPRIRQEVRSWIAELRNLVRGLDEVNKEVEQALGGDGQSKEKEGVDAMPDLASALFLAPQIIAQALIYIGTLLFFLMTRNGIYSWLSRHIGDDHDTEVIQERFTTVERLVSQYFIAISTINAGLGLAVGTVMTLLGLPGGWLWGLVAFMVNFVLYVGPIIFLAALLVTGVVIFDGVMSLAPAAAYLCLNMIEAQFVTPALLGRYMAVNPLLIFVSLVFWLWLWGPIGAIIAIPVTVFVLVMLDIFHPDESAKGFGADG
ncbi:AI-2E family transporter [Roseovarius sp. C7]|uniref:AI-2E family transporter n=1 Tax=Roseovarius sp. C7 TaxID=3398643 RepID=UPI0039F73701